MMTTEHRTKVEPEILVRERYIKHSILFGLIRWEEVIRCDRLSNILFVTTTADLDTIFVNGIEYRDPKNIKQGKIGELA